LIASFVYRRRHLTRVSCAISACTLQDRIKQVVEDHGLRSGAKVGYPIRHQFAVVFDSHFCVQRALITMLDGFLLQPRLRFSDILQLTAAWQGRTEVVKHLKQEAIVFKCNGFRDTFFTKDLKLAVEAIEEHLQRERSHQSRSSMFPLRLEDLPKILLTRDVIQSSNYNAMESVLTDDNTPHDDYNTYTHFLIRLFNELLTIYSGYVDVMDEILKANNAKQLAKMKRVIKKRLKELKEVNEKKDDQSSTEEVAQFLQNWCASRKAIADDLILAGLIEPAALKPWVKIIHKTVNQLLMNDNGKCRRKPPLIARLGPMHGTSAESFINKIGAQCDKELMKELRSFEGQYWKNYSHDHILPPLHLLIDFYQTLKRSSIYKKIGLGTDTGKNIFLRYMISSKILLESVQCVVHGRDCHGNTALHIAARDPQESHERQDDSEDLDAAVMVRMLVNHGGDVNTTNKSNETPLQQVICNHGRLRMGSLMLQLGDCCIWDCCKVSGTKSMACHRLLGRNEIWKDERVIAKLLDDFKHDINTADVFGGRPLFYAVKGNQEDAVNGLLSHGADYYAVEGDSYDTPVTIAILNNLPGILSLINKHDPEALSNSFHSVIRSIRGKTYGKEYENIENFIKKMDADNVKLDWAKSDADGNSVLHSLLSQPNVPLSLVKILIKKGVAVNATRHDGCTALHVVLKNYMKWDREKADTIIFYLLDNGADVELENVWQSTPFHRICFWPKEMRKSFLSSLKDKTIEARILKCIETPDLFGIQIGTADDVCDNMGNPEQYVKAYGYQFESIGLCLCNRNEHLKDNLKCRLNNAEFLARKSKNGRPFFHYCCWSSMTMQTEGIVNTVANNNLLSETDNLGRNLWHVVAKSHRIDIFEKLINAVPCDINKSRVQCLREQGALAQDVYGRTPIHYIAMEEKCNPSDNDSLKFILETLWEASCDIEDKLGRTPLCYVSKANEDFFDILKVECQAAQTNAGDREFNSRETPDSDDVKPITNFQACPWSNAKAVTEYLQSGNINFQQYLQQTCSNKNATDNVSQVWKRCLKRREQHSEDIQTAIGEFIGHLIGKISEFENGLQCDILPVGSGLENTRIAEFSEFDFNIKLVDFSSRTVRQSLDWCSSGYYSLKKAHESNEQQETHDKESNNVESVTSENKEHLDKFFDSDGTLMAANLQVHFINLLTRALDDGQLWDKFPQFERVEPSFSSFNPNSLGFKLLLNFTAHKNDKFVDTKIISIDIVPVVKSGDNLFTLSQPKSSKEKSPFGLHKCVKISFACEDSNAMNDSPCVIKAAYMVAKYLNDTGSDRYDIGKSYVLKCAALQLLNEKKINTTAQSYEEIDEETLRLAVELLLTKVYEFQQQDYVPLYNCPSVHIPVFDFEKHHVGLSKRVFDDLRVPYIDVSMMKSRQSKGIGIETVECVLRTYRYLWLVSNSGREVPWSSPVKEHK